MESHEEIIVGARSLAVQAARWLVLIRFQFRPGAPVFSAGISTYGEMLNPSGADDKCNAACAHLLPAVERQAVIEGWKGAEERLMRRAEDPFGLEWRTTERGAILETAAELLRAALSRYQDAGFPGGR